jgi:hypothetical protein
MCVNKNQKNMYIPFREILKHLLFYYPSGFTFRFLSITKYRKAIGFNVAWQEREKKTRTYILKSKRRIQKTPTYY